MSNRKRLLIHYVIPTTIVVCKKDLTIKKYWCIMIKINEVIDMKSMNRSLLYEKVVNELYNLIDRNEIMPGDKFPSERELVQIWDVSRNVLREAFHVLENRGIIVSKQGKGRYLRVLPEKEYKNKHESLSKNIERYSLLEIYEIRQVLEVKVIELLIENATQQDIGEIVNFYNDLSVQFVKSKMTVGEFEIHRMYSRKTKNLFLDQMINIVLKTILDMMNNNFYDIMLIHSPEECINDHRKIIEAIKGRNKAKGMEAMYNHVQHTINILAK